MPKKPITTQEIYAFLVARFETIDARFEKMDKRFETIEGQLDGLRTVLRAFKDESRASFEALSERTFARPIDREDLEARVKYIEKKLRINSGK